MARSYQQQTIDHFDATSLRAAAAILRRRSAKPDHLSTRVLLRLLCSVADDIDAGKRPEE